MSKSFRWGYILSGVMLALLCSLVLSALYGLLLSFTSLPESRLLMNIILAFSVFLAGWFGANRAGSKGLYHGLAIGAAFAATIFLLIAIFRAAPPSWLEIFERSLISLASGSLGGICGVLLHGNLQR
ncbi:MAG: TIGR04086 family membrane protein [Peptococcaceae bacterium]|jgi:putative membrane protein (TIGR04086 family)|nr:TIGR04086 family membrane protein [Peptococcaceae bacterium]